MDNIFVFDYISTLKMTPYDPIIIDKMSNMMEKLKFDIISSIYNIDHFIIHKYKEIYGKYPCTYLNYDNYIKRDENRIKLIVRKLKLNKILKNDINV